jgi:hypothetical protein
VAIVDAQSFWVVGYFEETKLRHIRVGNTAHIALMGFEPVLTGHVESIGHGIGDNNDDTGGLGLPRLSRRLTGYVLLSASRYVFTSITCHRGRVSGRLVGKYLHRTLGHAGCGSYPNHSPYGVDSTAPVVSCGGRNDVSRVPSQ